MHRRTPWTIASLLALAGFAVGCDRRGEPDDEDVLRPHVILISLDTLRADRLGVYGHRGELSTAIDAFAQQAVVFENHYVVAPTTLASHTSMMTGNHPHTHGVPCNGSVVHADNAMLAEVLSEAGYRTVAVLGASPLSSRTGFVQGFDVVDEVTGVLEDGRERRTRPGGQVNEAFFGWLDGRPADPAPLFAFLHYFDVHSPYIPPPSVRTAEVWRRIPDAGSFEHIQLTRRLLRDGDPDEARQHSEALEVLYEEGVRYIDYVMKHLFAGLRERGLMDRSIVILTADHGESFDAHDEYWNHGFTVYDASIHVPLIVRMPGAAGGGRREAYLQSNIDLFPTVLQLLGLPARTVEGHSFAPLLWGETMAGRAPVFAEATKPWTPVGDTWHNDPRQRGIRTQQHKYIHDPATGEQELYDVSADPGEQHNRVDAAEHQGIAGDLARQLQLWRESASPLPTIDADEAHLEALRALGYVESP